MHFFPCDCILLGFSLLLMSLLLLTALVRSRALIEKQLLTLRRRTSYDEASKMRLLSSVTSVAIVAAAAVVEISFFGVCLD